MLVVWDLETTGFSPVSLTSRYHRILEITMRHDESGDVFDATVNPEMKIPPWSTKVHGISDSDVQGSPKFKEVWTQSLQWLQQRRSDPDEVVWMVAHNCFGFDAAVLEKEVARLKVGNGKIPKWIRFGDTLPLSRRLMPGRGHGEYALGKLFEHITGRTLEGAHRASADAEALSYIVNHLKTLGAGDGFDKAPPTPVKLTDVRQIGPWRAHRIREVCGCNNTVKGLRSVVRNSWRRLDFILSTRLNIARPSTRAIIISGVMDFNTAQTIKCIKEMECKSFLIDPVDAVIEHFYVKDSNFKTFPTFMCQVQRGLSIIAHSQLGSKHVRW